MFGKLIEGQLIPAPNDVIIEDKRIINPDDKTLLSLGWLPVVIPEKPSIDIEHQEAVIHYEERNGTIVGTWTIVELPPKPPTDAERIAALEEELIATKILLGVQ